MLFETPRPDGLEVFEEFINEDKATDLLHFVGHQEWKTELTRRVIHYGARYDYGGRVGAPGSAPPIPQEIDWLVDRVRTIEGMGGGSMAVIVNEYLPGQGISAHIDHLGWGAVICTLSLGWNVPMTFENGDERLDVELPIRSLAVLTESARYEWTHAIAARKSDRVQGSRVLRSRRVSFTFRTQGDYK